MPDFVTVDPGEEILVSHINQFSGWLNGDDSNWYAEASPVGNSASAYTLTVRNAGSGGLALRVRNSTDTTDLFTVSDSGVSGLSAATSFAAGSASAPGFAVTGDSNTGFYAPGADQLGMAIAGTASFTGNTSGWIASGSLSASGILYTGANLDLAEQAGDPGAAGGAVRLYAKSSDGLPYVQYDNGAVVPLGTESVINVRQFGGFENNASIVTPTATATCTSGTVSSISITGNNTAMWMRTPTVTITGTGTGATATAVLSGASVRKIKVYSGGSGYATAPTVSISGGGGSGATATATVLAGAVTSVTVTASGSGFTSVPTVSFSGGGGSGASAVALMNGQTISSVTITNAGSGYNSATVTIDGAWYDTPTNVDANTDALEAALARASSGTRSRIVYIPDGVFVLNPINATNIANWVTLIASNGSASRFSPSVSCHGTNIAWLDTTGSASVQIYNLGFGDTAAPAIPGMGLLIANSDSGGNSSNVHYLEGVRYSGYYSIAAFYSPHCNSSRFVNSGFANAYTGGAAAAVYLSYQNKASVTSRFTTLSSTPVGITDLTFLGCEFHADTGSSTTNYAIRLENAAGVRFIGGPISASTTSAAIVRLDVDDVSGSAVGHCDEIIFKGCGLYTETGNPVSSYAFYIANPDSTGVVQGLTIEECATTVSTAIIRAEASTTLKKLRISGHNVYSTPTYLITPVSGSLTLTDPDIEANGLQINTGASGVITRGFLRNPGTVTASTNSTLLQQSDGSLVVRAGYVSLGDTPASTGAVRIAPTTSVRMRNADNTADLILFSANASNDIQSLVASGGTLGSLTIGQTATSGSVILASARGINLAVAGVNRLVANTSGLSMTGIATVSSGVTSSAGDIVASAGSLRGRKLISSGSAISTTDFATINGNWGTGATYSSATGSNLAGRVTVVAGSASITANPLITLTWKDSGYSGTTYIPTLHLLATDDTAVTSMLCPVTATAATFIQWQARFTPAATKTYTFGWYSLGD